MCNSTRFTHSATTSVQSMDKSQASRVPFKFSCYTVVFLDGPLNTRKYLDIIQRSLIPAVKRYWPNGADPDTGEKMIFMQDNHAAHKSRATMEYLEHAAEQLDFDIMAWPPHSPDLNPIENLWALFKAHLRKRRFECKPEEWPQRVAAEFRIFEQEKPQVFQNLYGNMKKRCNAVIHQKGGPTQY